VSEPAAEFGTGTPGLCWCGVRLTFTDSSRRSVRWTMSNGQDITGGTCAHARRQPSQVAGDLFPGSCFMACGHCGACTCPCPVDAGAIAAHAAWPKPLQAKIRILDGLRAAINARATVPGQQADTCRCAWRKRRPA